MSARLNCPLTQKALKKMISTGHGDHDHQDADGQAEQHLGRAEAAASASAGRLIGCLRRSRPSSNQCTVVKTCPAGLASRRTPGPARAPRASRPGCGMSAAVHLDQVVHHARPRKLARRTRQASPSPSRARRTSEGRKPASQRAAVAVGRRAHGKRCAAAGHANPVAGCGRTGRKLAIPMKRKTKSSTGLLEDLLRGPDLSDAALLVHDRQAVGDGQRDLLVVRHVEDRDAQVLLQRLDLEAHLLAQVGVEVAERLVEQQQARLGDQGARQRDALLLPAGELRGQPLLEAAEVHLARRPPASRPRSSAAATLASFSG